MNERPLFTHDCECCVYLGQTARHPHNVVDVYRHNDTLIMRYGDEGPQYYARAETVVKYTSTTKE